MRRRTFRKRRNKRKTKRRGGFRYPESENRIRGGGGDGAVDSRYTFSQPLTNLWRSGTHGLSNTFNTLMGRSHDVSPNVSDQPYLS